MKPDSSHSFDSAADLSISHPKLWQNKFQFFGGWICWGQDLVRLALLSPKETIQQCAGQNFVLYKYKYRRGSKYRYLFGWVSTVSHGDHSTMSLVRLFNQIESIYKEHCNCRRKCGGWSHKRLVARLCSRILPQSKIDGRVLHWTTAVLTSHSSHGDGHADNLGRFLTKGQWGNGGWPRCRTRHQLASNTWDSDTFWTRTGRARR